jgi:hypothetical protein
MQQNLTDGSHIALTIQQVPSAHCKGTDIDIGIYLYSKNPEMVTNFGYRTCHKSVYEGST